VVRAGRSGPRPRPVAGTCSLSGRHRGGLRGRLADDRCGADNRRRRRTSFPAPLPCRSRRSAYTSSSKVTYREAARYRTRLRLRGQPPADREPSWTQWLQRPRRLSDPTPTLDQIPQSGKPNQAHHQVHSRRSRTIAAWIGAVAPPCAATSSGPGTGPGFPRARPRPYAMAMGRPCGAEPVRASRGFPRPRAAPSPGRPRRRSHAPCKPEGKAIIERWRRRAFRAGPRSRPVGQGQTASALPGSATTRPAEPHI